MCLPRAKPYYLSSEFIAFPTIDRADKKGQRTFYVTLPYQRSLVDARVGLRKARVNALLKRSAQTIKITHPTHPLRGQSFEEVPLYGGKPDPTGILIALPNGKRQLIPLAWTDQVSQIKYPTNTFFLPDNLIRLRQQLDDLIERGAQEKAILEATKPEDSEPGGSHYASQSKPMESSESRIASPDHSNSSTDAAAVLDAGKGGGQ